MQIYLRILGIPIDHRLTKDQPILVKLPTSFHGLKRIHEKEGDEEEEEKEEKFGRWRRTKDLHKV